MLVGFLSCLCPLLMLLARRFACLCRVLVIFAACGLDSWSSLPASLRPSSAFARRNGEEDRGRRKGPVVAFCFFLSPMLLLDLLCVARGDPDAVAPLRGRLRVFACCTYDAATFFTRLSARERGRGREEAEGRGRGEGRKTYGRVGQDGLANSFSFGSAFVL